MAKPNKPTPEIEPTEIEPTRPAHGPLPREGVLAVLSASYELYSKGGDPELENIYTDPDTGTAYMAKANYKDKTILLSIMHGAHGSGPRETHERVYDLEQVMRWVHADL